MIKKYTSFIFASFSKLTFILSAVFIIVWANQSFSQGKNRNESAFHKDYYDSLKTMNYDRVLPFLGKKAYKNGYDIQLPYGASLIYFTQTQEINITSTKIGLNGGEKADLSNFIKFGPTIATTHALTFRPDIWVFPFLNIYGIIGGGTTQTDVTLLEPIGFETTQHFNATTFGIGATLAGAVGPLVVIWDNNYNFVDVDVIVEPVPAYNSSLRLGHNFIDNKRADRMLTAWVGTFYQVIQNDTQGSIPISDVFPSIGTGENIQRLKEWANGLPPAQKIIANQIIDKLEEYGQGADVGNAEIDYELNKKVAAPFNLLVGAQYQLNKHWMYRVELGVFGKRSQFLLNANYRF